MVSTKTMINYLIITKYQDPYPKEIRKTIAAGNPGGAVNRAFRSARLHELKGKKIKNITFQVSALGRVSVADNVAAAINKTVTNE